jgi:uncharacterized protein (TIGR00369 family)
MKKQPNSSMCYVCGLDNPIGLKLSFYDTEDGAVTATFLPRLEHQGYPGVLHGGVISSLLDETLGRLTISAGCWLVTARLSLSFHRPVPLGQKLTLIGRIVERNRRRIKARGELRLEDGAVAVEAEGIYMELPADKLEGMQAALQRWEVIPD